MFQFRRFPTHGYLIHHALPEVCSGGFPHSDISGSKLICSSPKLFAAYHVLHRLLMPRHSPCALVRLTNRIPFRERLQASVEFPVSGFSLFLIRIMHTLHMTQNRCTGFNTGSCLNTFCHACRMSDTLGIYDDMMFLAMFTFFDDVIY